jgi:hypothetical protein
MYMPVDDRPSVCIEPGRSGQWEVTLPGEDERVQCDTLDQARTFARRYATTTLPCQVIVHDAYHRVRDRELIEGGAG